jgi:radical SAM family uncharacterized protein
MWARIEPLLDDVERPARYLDSEWGVQVRPDASYRVALVYPDTYELGMANQALAILYDILNHVEGVGAERCFVPWKDMAAAMRAAGVPLHTLETLVPLRDCALVGVTLPHELTYTNILEMLDLAGIPLRAADRREGDPLVIAGGPCAFNPEPVAAFLDAVMIGEGEEAVLEIVEADRAVLVRGGSRAERLRALAAVPGVYVPGLYKAASDGAADGADGPAGTGSFPGAGAVKSADPAAPAVVAKRALKDLGSVRPPICPVVPYMDVVHDRAVVEVLRGCTRGCRFCQAGMVYRPVRERTADDIVRDVMATLRCTGQDEVSLVSLSTTDHSQIEEVLRRLTRSLEGRAVSVSLPSLRVDSFGVEMARLVSSGGKKAGLTFAPEAGTQRLRDVINKNITEDDLVATIEHAFGAGWRRVKLYFMIGLPTETDEDIRGIGALVDKVYEVARDNTPKDQRGGLKIGVSVSTFVPKPHTPFQWEPQVELDEVRRRQRILREAMPHRGVDLSWHDPEVSFLEGALARGGRGVADVIEAAWRSGCVFDAWTEEFSLARWLEAFEGAGIDPVALASAARDPASPLPWDHIASGVSKRYLLRERDRALEGLTTKDCSFDGCTGCDACGDLGLDIVLGGASRG